MKRTMKKSLVVIMAVSTMMTTGAAYASIDNSPQPTAYLPIVTTQVGTQPVSITVSGETISESGFLLVNGTEPMIPLRAVSEKLGFTLVWHQETLSVDLNKNAVFTTVTTGADRYSINKMYTTLGTAPQLVDNKLYVPASFVSKVLHGSVAAKDNTVSISLEEQKKKVQATGVITEIKSKDNYQSIHIKGVGTEGIVLNVGPETGYQMLDGTKINFSDLHVGLTVVAEHSLVSTLSLPPQTPTYKITVLDTKTQEGTIGTVGEIEEVRTSDTGKVSLLIKGTGLSDTSPDEVVLNLSDDTVYVDKDGEAVQKSALVKGAKVIAYYGPVMTKSLPPIGKAWKIVVDTVQE